MGGIAQLLMNVLRAIWIPEHIIPAVIVADTSKHKQQVRKSVEGDEHVLIQRLRFCQSQHIQFRSPADSSGQV